MCITIFEWICDGGDKRYCDNIRTYMCMHTQTHTTKPDLVKTCTHKYTHENAHVRPHAHIHVHTLHTHDHKRSHTNAHTCKRTHTHIDTHIHTRTYRCLCMCNQQYTRIRTRTDSHARTHTQSGTNTHLQYLSLGRVHSHIKYIRTHKHRPTYTHIQPHACTRTLSHTYALTHARTYHLRFDKTCINSFRKNASIVLYSTQTLGRSGTNKTQMQTENYADSTSCDMSQDGKIMYMISSSTKHIRETRTL